jgi:hypothetical protein
VVSKTSPQRRIGTTKREPRNHSLAHGFSRQRNHAATTNRDGDTPVFEGSGFCPETYPLRDFDFFLINGCLLAWFTENRTTKARTTTAPSFACRSRSTRNVNSEGKGRTSDGSCSQKTFLSEKERPLIKSHGAGGFTVPSNLRGGNKIIPPRNSPKQISSALLIVKTCTPKA